MFFTETNYVPAIEQLSFNLSHARILGSMECGKSGYDCFRDNASKNNLNFEKDYAEKFSKANSIELHSKHWGGNIQLSMEGIAVEYFPTSVDIGNNKERSGFCSYIIDDNKQDARDSHAHMVHILIFFRIRKISVWYVNSMGRHRWLCKSI